MRKWIYSILILVVLVVLVRLFVPGILEDQFNKVTEHSHYVIDEQTKAQHRSLFIADLHSDSLLWERDFNQRSSHGHVDLPRLLEGNVALQVFTAVTKSPPAQNYQENTGDSDSITLLTVSQLWPVKTWSSLKERALYQAGKLEKFAASSNKKLRLVRNKKDLENLIAARASGEPSVGAIYGIEGAHPLEGEIANLDELVAAGMRVLGLTHFFDNSLGGSLHGISGEGLTAFGRVVIQRANELELVIDIAHASPQMVRDVLELSTRPVILSHGAMKGLCDNGRNLDDELMRKFAARGGLLGVGYWEGAVCDNSPTGIAKMVRYAIEVMGVEHVALGSDYDGATEVQFDTSEIAVLTQAMIEQEFTDTEIAAVMGGNVQKFFLANLPAN